MDFGLTVYYVVGGLPCVNKSIIYDGGSVANTVYMTHGSHSGEYKPHPLYTSHHNSVTYGSLPDQTLYEAHCTQVQFIDALHQN